MRCEIENRDLKRRRPFSLPPHLVPIKEQTTGKNVPAVHVSHRTLTLKRERNAFLDNCKLMVGSMASSSSILTSPEQKNSPSIDAVLGNDDLITEILLRVPPKAVLRFKLVSKKWFSIISKTSFATRHTLLNPHTVSALLLRVTLFFKERPTNKYVSLDVDGRSLAYFPHDFLDFDPTNNPGCIHISQSCNGLLLCSTCSWDRPERFQPINYIFNPTTRQFGMLPPPPDNGLYFDSMQLVFDPSESSCYRVVCTQFLTSELKIYVYSSETKDWKLCVSQENFEFLPLNFTNGVSWNDAVHWISPMGNGLSFLLDKECLETFPRPPLPENWQEQNFRYFGESGGHLHFIGVLEGNQNPDDLNKGIVSPDMSHDHITDQSIVVYTMERGFSKWFVKYCLHMKASVMAYPEITEDEDLAASPFSAEKGPVHLLSFIDGDKDERPLLVMQIPGEIISYCFKDKTFKKILRLPFKQAICHAFNHSETLSCV